MNDVSQAKPRFWTQFLNFALKGNAMDLAIAVVVGGAFSKITTSIVNDLVMPLVNPLIPGGDWRNLMVGPGVRIGSFADTLLDFLIITFSLFVIIRWISRVRNNQASANKTPRTGQT